MELAFVKRRANRATCRIGFHNLLEKGKSKGENPAESGLRECYWIAKLAWVGKLSGAGQTVRRKTLLFALGFGTAGQQGHESLLRFLLGFRGAVGEVYSPEIA
jgi:hypothetical protein